MKKIALVGAALALAMISGSASAAGKGSEYFPSAGTFGMNVGVGSVADPATDFVVSGRYFFARDMAILAGVGLRMADNGAPTNSKSTDIGFMGGFRKYLKTDELAPFVGGQLQYLSTKQTSAGVSADVSAYAVGAEAGAEYFLSKQFSFEGSVFVGYTSTDVKPTGATNSTKATSFGTAKGNLSVNFYF